MVERRAAETLAELFSSCHFQAKVVCCGVKMTPKVEPERGCEWFNTTPVGGGAEERLVMDSRFRPTFILSFHSAIFLMISGISEQPQRLRGQKEQLDTADPVWRIVKVSYCAHIYLF